MKSRTERKSQPERVQEILGKPPKKITIYGFFIVGFILVSFITVSWIIPYPETVNAMTVVYPTEQQTIITSSVKAEIQKRRFKDGDEVRKGDTLLILKEPVVLDSEIHQLSRVIASVEACLDNNDKVLTCFEASQSHFVYFDTEYGRLENELKSLSRIPNDKSSPGIQESIVLQKKVVSVQANALKDSIAARQKAYFVKSPADGKVRYLTDGSVQSVIAGDYVAVIVPVDKQVICKIAFRPDDIDKIKSGQQVKIVLDQYPRDKYGELHGTVKNIYPVQIDGLCIASVELASSLKTTTGIELSITSKQKGMGKVVVKQRSLLGSLWPKIGRMSE